jgi:hypothetical protein
MNTYARPLATVMCLFALLTGPLTDGLVVCVGEDGHVSFEFASLPQWQFEKGANPADPAAFADCDDDCGPCRDSRLRSGEPTFRETQSRGGTVTSLDEFSLVTEAVPPPAAWSLHSDAVPSTPRSAPLALQRTVLLLI